MLRTMLMTVAGLVFALSASEAQATYIYKFSGTVPNGASIVGLPISVAETWTAIVSVDESIADSDPGDPTVGVYIATGGVILSFSGGYKIEFSGTTRRAIVVCNNCTDGSVQYDFVQASIFDGVNDLQVQALTEADSSALTSDALPVPGTSFASAPFPASSTWIQLSFGSAGGSINYDGRVAMNVEFEAMVPAPATLVLLGIGLAGVAAVRRRKSPAQNRPVA